MQHIEVLKLQMPATPDQQIPLTDPDSRSMATSGRGSGVVGYNVQVAVDTAHHQIITHEVTNVGTGPSQLSSVAKDAKAKLETENLDAVADRGYFSSQQILECEKAGITVTLPKPMTSHSKAEGRFGKQDFRYLVEENVYVCPAGERLTYLHNQGKWIGLVPVLDQCLPELRHQAQLHHRQGASDHTLGARAYSRGSPATPRRASGEDAPAARDSRASLSAPSRPGWVQPTS
jgi:hypothetical protein